MTLHFPNFWWRATARYALLSTLTLGALTACSDSTGSSGSESPRINFLPYPYPQAVSPDGKTVMIQNLGGATGSEIYLYDVATRHLSLSTAAGPNPNDIAWGLSNNGVIASAYGDPVQAGIWTQAAGWQALPLTYPAGCDPFLAMAWDVSADGSVVVAGDEDGCASTSSYLWSNGTVTQLEILGAGQNVAQVISDDGSTAAGHAPVSSLDRWPAIWHADGSGFLLPSAGIFPDDCPGDINALSADGSMAAGVWCQHAFYWTQSGGPVDLGLLPGTDPSDASFANAIAANGQLIFGTNGNGFNGPQQPFVWTAALGMRSLPDLLNHFISKVPEGYTLLTANAASADGTVVIGQALGPDGPVSYVLTAPVQYYGL